MRYRNSWNQKFGLYVMSSQKYDLYQLGWHSFQQLCLAVTTEVLGQTVESYLDGNDGGRDGAFQGVWKTEKGQALAGQFVIQCKFTARRGHNLTRSDIAEELGKAEKLVQRGLCDVYLLMTNAGITGVSSAKIREAFRAVGVKDVLIFDSTWLCQKIEMSSKLRMNVPRLYGLGDLSHILDERRYKQTKALLSELKPDLAKTVVTDTYHRALRALETHGFVLLVGEPAAGKTTIASLLAMCAMDVWKSQVFKLTTPEQVSAHWNTEEASRFIWVDDAFGVTQYESHLVMGWNRTLDGLKAMIKLGHRVVMTSRDYIYNQARRELKKTSFPLFDESQVVIDVRELSLREKEQILYNHLKLGNQGSYVLCKLKPFLPAVASSPRFIPETARRLGNSQYTKSLKYSESSINEFVVKQEQILLDTLYNMDEHSRAALALIYMKEGALESPVTVTEQEQRALQRLGSSEANCLRALEDLNGSFVQLVDTEVSRIWRYKHPTVGDAFALILAGSPEHLAVFVEGTSTERLMDLVTCGNVGVTKASIIPPGLFEEMAMRIKAYRMKKSDQMPHHQRRERFYSFLSGRCSRDFLIKYLCADQELLERVVGDFSRSWIGSSLSFAKRLLELRLLPEDYRLRIVHRLVDDVQTGEELVAIHDADLHAFFTPAELDDFLGEVKEDLALILESVRQNCTGMYEFDGDAESHISELVEDLESILIAHPTWPDIEHIISVEKRDLNDWVLEVSDGDEPSEPMIRSGSKPPVMTTRRDRSIFDDIDI